MKDVKLEVRNIIAKHTEAMLTGVRFDPEDNQALYEHMAGECAYILTEALLDGEYTPMEYNAIRNALANTLWDIFAPHVTGRVGQLTRTKKEE